jgi:hypothetical protein
VISRTEAHAALAGLGVAYDRIAAAMYAVDAHPGLRLLKAGTLTGVTADRWRSLAPEVDRAWALFSALGDSLEQARAVYGRRRLDTPEWTELERLLRGPVVALGPDGLPVEAVAAGGSPLAAPQLTVEALAQQLEARVAAVLGQLSEVEAAWTAVASAYAAVAEQTDAAVALAAEVGAVAAADPLRAAIAEVERLDRDDPLAAAPAGRLRDATRARLDALAVAADRLRQELAELVRLRDGYPARRTALVSLLDAVAAAEQGVAAAQQRAIEKIANPGLGAVPAAAAVLRARVPALDRLALDAQWRQLATEMSTVEASATRARDRAGELTRVAEGLLARRDELRGRLDAFRAKAAARGYAEHDGLSVAYTRARDLLFTAPCDLRASTRAVHDYQQTLASVLGPAGSLTGERSAVDD